MRLYPLTVQLPQPHQTNKLTNKHTKPCYSLSQDKLRSLMQLDPITLHLSQFDLSNLKSDHLQIRSQIGKMRKVVLCDSYIVWVYVDKHRMGCVEVDKLYNQARNKVVLLQNSLITQHCNIVYASDDIQYQLNYFTIWMLQCAKTPLSIYLSASTLIIQQIGPLLPLILTKDKIGLNNNDKIINMSLCKEKMLFDGECSKELMIMVIQIRDDSGGGTVGVVEVLWDVRQYLYSPIVTGIGKVCIGTGRDNSNNGNLLVCTLGNSILALSSHNNIVLTQRTKQGWSTLFILSLPQLNISSLVGYQQAINKNHHYLHQYIIIAGKCKQGQKIVRYSVRGWMTMREMEGQEVNVVGGREKGGEIGFVQVSLRKVMVRIGRQWYGIGQCMLQMCRTITACPIKQPSCPIKQPQPTSQTQLSLQHILLSMDIPSPSTLHPISCLPFLHFKQHLLSSSSKIQQHLSILFSANRLKQSLQDYHDNIREFLPGYTDDEWVGFGCLVDQMVLVLVYLTHFVRYSVGEYQRQGRETFQYCINDRAVVRQLLNLPALPDPILSQRQIYQTLYKPLTHLLPNLLTLLQTTTTTSPSSIQSLFTTNQLLLCLTDHTYIADRLAFTMIQAGLAKDRHQWRESKKILQKVCGLRKDYHPMIQIMAGRGDMYLINRHHLEYCRMLAEGERQELQGLPSLKLMDCAATAYLKKHNLQHLPSFIPSNLANYKYSPSMIVLTIPQNHLSKILTTQSSHLLQLNNMIYFKIQLSFLSKLIEQMQNIKIINPILYCTIPNEINYVKLSQKIKIYNQIFIGLIREQYRVLEHQREKNEAVRYDLKMYSNQVYEDYLSLFQERTKHKKMEKQYQSYSYVLIVQKYLEKLVDIGQEFKIGHLFEGVKKKEGRGRENVSVEEGEEEMGSLDLSQIGLQQNSIPQMIQQQNKKDKNGKSVQNKEQNVVDKEEMRQLTQVVYIHMWSLYDTLVQISQHQFEVQQQLHHTQLPKTLLSILTVLSQTYNTNHYNTISSMKTKENQMNKIFRRAEKQQKEYIGKPNQKMDNVMRIELINKKYQKHQGWIYDIKDLL